MRKLHGKRNWVWLVVLPLLASLGASVALSQKQPAASEPSSVAWKAPAEGTADDYIGRDTCAGCHPDQDKQFAKTVHAKIEVAGTKYGTGCESCHGPGKAHAEGQMEAGGEADKVEAAKKLIYSFHGKPQDNAARCLACHQSSREQDVYNRSEHKLQGVSCDQCHSAHLLEHTATRERVEPALAQTQFFAAPRLTEENRWLNQSLLKKSQPDLCYTCHKVIQAQFSLPTHHRVPEGLMKCTDCHNAHGTATRPLLKRTGFEICVSCHTEKRGPFVFEHAAVKVEGCTVCHSPHGTIERNMLLRREGRFMCLQCHVDPLAVNVPHGRLSWTTRGECVRCHVVIHGSQTSEYFLE